MKKKLLFAPVAQLDRALASGARYTGSSPVRSKKSVSRLSGEKKESIL